MVHAELCFSLYFEHFCLNALQLADLLWCHAQRMELDAALQARVSENKATSQEVLNVQTKLAAVKDETAAEKEAFILECRTFDDQIRC